MTKDTVNWLTSLAGEVTSSIPLSDKLSRVDNISIRGFISARSAKILKRRVKARRLVAVWREGHDSVRISLGNGVGCEKASILVWEVLK